MALTFAMLFAAAPALGAETTIRMESADLGPGESATLTLEALGFAEPGLGAITIEVGYDPGAVAATACEADPEEIFDLALCNEEFADGTVKVTAVDAQGESGDFALARITFAAIGDAGRQTLDVTIVTLADPAGANLEALSEDGALLIDSESEAVDVEDEAAAAEDEAADVEGEAAAAEEEAADVEGEAADSEASSPIGAQASDNGGNPLLQTDQPWLYVAVAVLAAGVAAAGFALMRRRGQA